MSKDLSRSVLFSMLYKYVFCNIQTCTNSATYVDIDKCLTFLSSYWKQNTVDTAGYAYIIPVFIFYVNQKYVISSWQRAVFKFWIHSLFFVLGNMKTFLLECLWEKRYHIGFVCVITISSSTEKFQCKGAFYWIHIAVWVISIAKTYPFDTDLKLFIIFSIHFNIFYYLICLIMLLENRWTFWHKIYVFAKIKYSIFQ